MRNVLLVSVVIVLLLGIYAFSPVLAGPVTNEIVIAQADTKAGDAPAKEEKSAGGEPPETVLFEKTGKMAPVNFPHQMHAEKNECKDCHEEGPKFEMKISGQGYNMKDMYAGKSCGACHNGKEGKPFDSKKCVKCHKKK